MKNSVIAAKTDARDSREPSVCEACGESFACGASLSGCWCTEIKLSDEIRAELGRNYQGCLCRTCLEKQVGRMKAEG